MRAYADSQYEQSKTGTIIQSGNISNQLIKERYLFAANIKDNDTVFIFRSLSAAKRHRFGHVLRSANTPITYTLAREIILKAFMSRRNYFYVKHVKQILDSAQILRHCSILHGNI